jgi:DNA polymerase V
VGLPVCVGIGASKTLAKLANYLAKKRPGLNGVCDLNSIKPNTLDSLLSTIEVREVWGVGKRIEQKLIKLGINNVLDLRRSSPRMLRKQFSIVMERTVRELNGELCIPLEETPPSKKQLVCSRGFGKPISSLSELSEAITTYAARVAEKLRYQRSLATMIYVFIQTNSFKKKDQQYNSGRLIHLTKPTNDSRKLISAALVGLKSIYKTGFFYKKAGVLINDILPVSKYQKGLFDDTESQKNSESLMKAMDGINDKMGSGTIKFIGEGLKKNWGAKAEKKTPCYTTNIDEIPVAYSI